MYIAKWSVLIFKLINSLLSNFKAIPANSTRVVGGRLGPLMRPAGPAVGAVGLAARHHGARRARH